MFDAEAVRRDFPILQERVNGRPLVWLDNAATTQKPQAVIDRISYFYEHENSNIHRAAHALAARATDAYEAAREKVRRFLNASSVKEIVFVRGTTEAINLVAQSWGRRNIGKGDEIVLTWLEHHANIVPWQLLRAEKGAKLRVAPVDDDGQVLLDEYEKLLEPAHAAGVAHARLERARHGHAGRARWSRWRTATARACWSTARRPCRTCRSTCRRSTATSTSSPATRCSRPTGIGVVYGKPDVLEQMPPWQGGGNMIEDVTFEKTIYQPPPGALRGRHRQHRRRRRPRRGARLPAADRHGERSRATSTTCWRTPPRRCARCPACA